MTCLVPSWLLRTFLRTLYFICATGLLLAGASPAFAAPFSFFHENVLGTSLELRIACQDKDVAKAAEATALRELDRLSKIYSHYDSGSEFSQFLKLPIGQTMTLSAELAETLALCDRWIERSDGAFNPGAGAVSSIWKAAAKSQTPPSQAALIAAVKRATAKHWRLGVGGRSVTRLSATALSLNAIAKGVVLDRVAETLARTPDIQGVMVNIGGDIRIAGDMTVEVAIADPRADSLGAKKPITLNVSSGAIATSGVSERGFEIAEKTYSHIIDPRSGQPSGHHTSVTIRAQEAATADVLATICSVLPTAECLRLIESIDGAECLIFTEDGRTISSSAWPAETGASLVAPAAAKHEMLVQFEIAKPANARRYRRPYVAVWVEDEDDYPVKILSLFLMQNDPGPRWYRDLRRWYRGDRMREAVEETHLIQTVSKPTRNPGTYKIVWDGRDNDGKMLPPGEYSLLIESAREHGNYRLIKTKFTLGTPFQSQLKANEEISAASVHYEVH